MKIMREARPLAFYLKGGYMVVAESDYQILKLTDVFFLSYPNPPI